MRFIYTKTFAALIGSLIIVVVLLFAQHAGWLEPVTYAASHIPRPIARLFGGAIKPIKGLFGTLYNLRIITKENGFLTARLQELQQQLVLQDQYRLENEMLKRELGFVKSSPLRLIPCTVLAIDPQGLTDALLLSCAEKEGIKEGQAVIANGFLVAKVVVTGTLTSTAQLITHPKSTIDAKLSSTGSEGVVGGSFGSGLLFELRSQDSNINRGDIVVTAGIDGIIPKNVPVGEVRDIVSKDNDLFKKATLASPIGFQSLGHVFVVVQ
jgi:rod shape-determining protein MreC